MSERAGGERSGFALIGVLWLVVLVSGTHEVLVASGGWVPGAVMRAHAEAIVVRSGASVFMVERSVR